MSHGLCLICDFHDKDAQATDHALDIKRLRNDAKKCTTSLEHMLALDVAADLLEMHDQTGISLDSWGPGRRFVENMIGHPIIENHV